MEDLLNNGNEIMSVKSRIIANLPSINKIIKNILNLIDPALLDTFDEFKQNIQKELTKSNVGASHSPETASIEEIDDFFRNFNYDSLQPSMDKPITKGKKLTRAQTVNYSTGKSLSESRYISGSYSSLTPSSSIPGTVSHQNLNSVTFEQEHHEIDRTALKKISEIKLNSQFLEDISTNYPLEAEQFRESCTQLDQFLTQMKMPKVENIKTLIVIQEANQLAAELKKAIKDLVSILQIDLKQVNNIFECHGDPFPLYEVLTELYQVL